MEKESDINNYYNIDFYKSLKGKEALNERIDKGRLPIIDIAGQPFFADSRIGLLRPINIFNSMGIELAELPMDPVTKKLSFEYHIPSMTRTQVSAQATELPKDVVRVVVPNMYFLDPIGMARRNGKDARYYQEDGITLRMYRKAKIVPLKKTELLAQVNQNRKRAGMEPLGAERKQQINTEKKKRMRL